MSPSELKLLVISPTVKNWPILLGLGLLLVFTGILGLVLLIIEVKQALPILIVGIGFMVWPALKSANTEYWITNVRVVVRSTLFGTSETEIAISDIKELKIERTSLQKAVGIGDVVVRGSQGSVRLSGVDFPEEIIDKIETLA